ncbi:hypothetical protein BG000_008971 [Podila horticola]|nr:hypothetical protein BG000_008971 [Podila horticola]
MTELLMLNLDEKIIREFCQVVPRPWGDVLLQYVEGCFAYKSLDYYMAYIKLACALTPFDRDEHSVRWAENTRQALRHSLDICVHKAEQRLQGHQLFQHRQLNEQQEDLGQQQQGLKQRLRAEEKQREYEKQQQQIYEQPQQDLQQHQRPQLAEQRQVFEREKQQQQFLEHQWKIQHQRECEPQKKNIYEQRQQQRYAQHRRDESLRGQHGDSSNDRDKPRQEQYYRPHQQYSSNDARQDRWLRRL